jgi:hypothetical protein
MGQPVRKKIDLRVERQSPTDFGWTLELITDVVPVTGAISEVTLVAYSEQGTVVCERAVGELEGGINSYQLECSGFPVIISAETDADCYEVATLYWVGTDQQQQQAIPSEITEDVILWETTERECGEPVPVDRLVRTVEQTPQAGATQTQ